MAAKWFIEKDGNWQGPFALERIKALVRLGRLQVSDLLLKGEDGKPIHATMVKGLFEDMVEPRTVPPPLLNNRSVTSTNFKSQSATVVGGDARVSPNADEPVGQSTSRIPQPPPLPQFITRQPSSSGGPRGPSTSSNPSSNFNLGFGDATSPEDGNDLGLETAVKSAVTEFRALNYDFLIPFRKIISRSLFKKKAVRWVIGFGIFPLLLMFLKEKLEWTFVQSIWFVGGYFCVFWAAYFYEIVRPDRNVWQRGVKWALFTVLVGLPLLFIAQQLPLINTLYSGSESHVLVFQIMGFVLGVGILEETCKALPLLIFAVRKNEILSLKNGIFLGMMSGFGFALAEVVQYSMQYWGESAAVSVMAIVEAVDGSTTRTGRLNAAAFGSQMEELLPSLVEFYGDTLLAQIVRFMTLPLLHACWTGTVGWFIAVASQQRGSRWPIIVVGIAFMAVLHGLYDVFSDGLLGIGLAAVSLLVFVGYLLHGQEDEQ